MLTLGATKNGVLSTDAIVSFDERASAELSYRTKRAGHVASKMRFQSVQLERYLSDGLWLELAGRANAVMARLSAGLTALGIPMVAQPEANLVFVELSRSLASHLASEGVAFYDGLPGGDVELSRFVTSFQTTDDEVDHVLAVIADGRARES